MRPKGNARHKHTMDMPKKPPTPLTPNNRRLVLAAIATFVFFAMPFAVWQITSNSDEPRYTLAAARMMATGDYIIPYAAWGEIRLLKPPLTYYYVVAGMGLLGQSVLAVKIMWLISAAAVLALTWQLARAIGADQRAAAMATAALGANLLFFQSALTHNPDMPMVLGLTLALLGFARLCDSAPAPRWAVFAAWGGLAWAFLAKGMLALVLAGVAVLVRVALHRLRRRPGLAWPGRPEWLAIGLALIGGGWWHAVVALRAPEALMAQFFGDQVSEKVALTLGDYLTGLVFFATAAVIGFVPVLLALVGRRTGDIGWRASHPLPGPVLLMGAWIITCIAIFAFSNFRVGRYMLPAMPALATLLALGFTGMSEAQLARRCGRAVRTRFNQPEPPLSDRGDPVKAFFRGKEMENVRKRSKFADASLTYCNRASGHSRPCRLISVHPSESAYPARVAQG